MVVTPRSAEDKKQSFVIGGSEGAVQCGTGRFWRTSVRGVKVHGALLGHRGRGNTGGRHLMSGYTMEDLAGLHVVALWNFYFFVFL